MLKTIKWLCILGVVVGVIVLCVYFREDITRIADNIVEFFKKFNYGGN